MSATVAALVVVACLLRVDTGTSTFFDRGGAQWEAYQAAISDFGGDEYVAVSIEGARPYDWLLMARLEPLSSKLSEIPGVRRVDSLATVPLIREGEAGTVLTDAAIEGGVPEAAEARAELAREIDSDLVADRFLISGDRRHLALNVMLDRDLDADRSATVGRIRRVVSDLPAVLTGVPVFRTEVNKRTQLEVALFVPATVLLISVVAYLWVRSWVGVLALLGTGGAGSAVSLAAMSVTDVPLSLSTMLLPSVLLALGCAYAGHVLVATARARRGVSFDAVAAVVPGIAWSGVTTAIGFAAMSTTSVDAIRQLAAYGALGVFVVATAAISLVPAVLSLGGRGPSESRLLRRCGAAGTALASASYRHRVPVITAWVVASVVIGTGATQLTVETNIIEWFGRSDPIRLDYEAIRDQFSGITPVSIVLRSDGERRVTEPEVLESVEQLRLDLEGRDVVGRALAVTQPLRAFRKAFGREGLPQSSAEAEQYLLLLENEERISDLISSDRLATSVWVRMDSNDSADIVGMSTWVGDWWEEHGASGLGVRTTGVMYEFARAQDAIASSQIRGLGIAVVAVGIVLCIALQSVKLALLAIVPNTLPIALGFGGMGLLGVPIDAATVCIGSLALGIAVDDTVHVMLALKGAEGSGVRSPALAVCLSPVIPALVLTTICIVVGFGILGLSTFTLVRNLGVVTAGVVLLCLAADLTLLPAMVSRGRLGRLLAEDSW